jgi:hypothetical protein
MEQMGERKAAGRKRVCRATSGGGIIRRPIRSRQQAVALLSLLAISLSAAPVLAKPQGSGGHTTSGMHPSHWRHDPHRWHGSNWNRNYRHNHWNHPVSYRHHHPGWARHDWQRHRPWNHGWYGRGWYGNVPSWGWWAPQAAAWGISSLATAAMINDAVTAAIDRKQSTIAVPGSKDQLDYGSLAVPSNDVTTFVVNRDGRSFRMDADCRDGELNGHAPNDAAEAQLLNAACQIAFGGS